jgi:hypothetical protein
MKTTGMTVVAALAARMLATSRKATITAKPRLGQLGRKCRQAIMLILGPAIFKYHVLALGEAKLTQSSAESAGQREILPPPYRQRRSRTVCAAMTATS